MECAIRVDDAQKGWLRYLRCKIQLQQYGTEYLDITHVFSSLRFPLINAKKPAVRYELKFRFS